LVVVADRLGKGHRCQPIQSHSASPMMRFLSDSGIQSISWKKFYVAQKHLKLMSV
jgi:hypothetical protein